MLRKIYKITITSTIGFVLPVWVFAFPSDFKGVVDMFIKIGLRVIPFFGVVAFLVFVLGVARYIKKAGSGEDIKESKNLLIWGIIGMFVLVTIWGIIAFLRNEFEFGSGNLLIPQISFPPSAAS